MLRELSVRDILLIEALELEFQPGLNVLTGETGAGKSILLDCLGVVLGWRGRADIVRKGASQGEVTAVFDLHPGHPARSVLEEAGLPWDDSLILRRITSADGRKRGFINDRRASGEVLRALSATLVELHGQQDDKGLLDVRAHRGLLDAFGAHEAERAAVSAAWTALREARKAEAAAAQALEEAGRDAEFLRHAVAELEALDPQPGEDETLDIRRRQMQQADKIRGDVTRAAEVMGGEGAEARMAEAIRWLEVVADRAEGALDTPIAALGRAMIELDEAQAGVRAFLGLLDFDPSELEAVEERLFALRGLARKHGVGVEALPELAQDLSAKLAAIDGGDAALKGLRAEVAAAQAAYDTAAAALSAKRARSAAALDKAMAAELPPLKLERAVFKTEVEAGPAGPDGADQVQFTVSTNPGAPAGPLGRIASGGELSRFLLALKVCLSGRAEGLTMIFDEIDRGVGGATADAVGRRLAQVAQAAQVLVVTHAPQVAAQGAHHFRVEKRVTSGETLTEVAALGEAARVDELARMLAGDTITEAAREAARALLGSKIAV